MKTRIFWQVVVVGVLTIQFMLGWIAYRGITENNYEIGVNHVRMHSNGRMIDSIIKRIKKQEERIKELETSNSYLESKLSYQTELLNNTCMNHDLLEERIIQLETKRGLRKK